MGVSQQGARAGYHMSCHMCQYVSMCVNVSQLKLVSHISERLVQMESYWGSK